MLSQSLASLTASAASAAGIQGFSTDEAHVRISELRLHNLPNADLNEGAGDGSSDPFVVVIVVAGDGTKYKGRTVTLQNVGRTAKWTSPLAIKVPDDLDLDACTLIVQVWDEDDGKLDDRGEVNDHDLMGKLSLISLTGRTGLELEGEEFTNLAIKGEGTLHDFQISFHYECFNSRHPLPPEASALAAAGRRTLLRFKSVARAVYLGGGRAGALDMHPLPMKPVQLRPAAHPPRADVEQKKKMEPFDAFEYVSDLNGIRRGAGRLAIVTHPLGESQGGGGGGLGDPSSSAEAAAAAKQHIATLPLHHRLVERGWNLLVYEAHRLSDDSGGAAEVAKLRAAMAYCAEHRQLRYCRISLFAQGTGACAAFMALHDHPEEFGYRVQFLSACEPTADPKLSEDVVSTYAPSCRVPTFLSHCPPSSTAGPSPPLPRTAAGPATTTIMPMARKVASSLPSTTPSRTVLVHNYPLRGAARRIEGSRFLGDHPEQLFPFLEHHSRPLHLQTKLGHQHASRGWSSTNAGPSAAPSRGVSRLNVSRTAPELRPSTAPPLRG